VEEECSPLPKEHSVSKAATGPGAGGVLDCDADAENEVHLEGSDLVAVKTTTCGAKFIHHSHLAIIIISLQ